MAFYRLRPPRSDLRHRQVNSVVRSAHPRRDSARSVRPAAADRQPCGRLGREAVRPVERQTGRPATGGRCLRRATRLATRGAGGPRDRRSPRATRSLRVASIDVSIRSSGDLAHPGRHQRDRRPERAIEVVGTGPGPFGGSASLLADRLEQLLADRPRRWRSSTPRTRAAPRAWSGGAGRAENPQVWQHRRTGMSLAAPPVRATPPSPGRPPARARRFGRPSAWARRPGDRPARGPGRNSSHASSAQAVVPLGRASHRGGPTVPAGGSRRRPRSLLASTAGGAASR